MFSSPAYAQAAGGAGAAPSALIQFLPLVFIFVIFYVLMIRPQQKRLKDHRAMIDAVKKGDTVVTGGGLIGKVTRVEADEIEVELAPSVKVKVVKGTLSDVRGVSVQKPANDSAAS